MAHFTVFTLDGPNGRKLCSGFSLEKVRELNGTAAKHTHMHGLGYRCEQCGHWLTPY